MAVVDQVEAARCEDEAVEEEDEEAVTDTLLVQVRFLITLISSTDVTKRLTTQGATGVEVVSNIRPTANPIEGVVVCHPRPVEIDLLEVDCRSILPEAGGIGSESDY